MENCDHDWEFADDSFDHEYGCEQIHYWRCVLCRATRDMEDSDYPDRESDLYA